MAEEKYEYEVDVGEGFTPNKGKPVEKEVEAKSQVDIEVEDDTPEEDRGRQPMPKELVEKLDQDELDKYDEEVKSKLKQMKKVYHDERREKERAAREREEALTEDVLGPREARAKTTHPTCRGSGYLDFPHGDLVDRFLDGGFLDDRDRGLRRDLRDPDVGGRCAVPERRHLLRRRPATSFQSAGPAKESQSCAEGDAHHDHRDDDVDRDVHVRDRVRAPTRSRLPEAAG